MKADRIGALTHLSSYHPFKAEIGAISKSISGIDSEKNEMIRNMLHKLDNYVEKLFRRGEILNKVYDNDEFIKNVMWMAEMGDEDDFESLKKMENNSLYPEKNIHRFFNRVLLRMHKRLNDPHYILKKGMEAFREHEKEWGNVYRGQFIAIYRGKVVANALDEKVLMQKIRQKQQQDGPFRAYVVQVGASPIYMRGPRAKRPDRETAQGLNE
ncbi:MAG: hypothetical protein AB7N91_16200 [Candidatus Tectimicrobiota bacterium]